MSIQGSHFFLPGHPTDYHLICDLLQAKSTPWTLDLEHYPAETGYGHKCHSLLNQVTLFHCAEVHSDTHVPSVSGFRGRQESALGTLTSLFHSFLWPLFVVTNHCTLGASLNCCCFGNVLTQLCRQPNLVLVKVAQTLTLAYFNCFPEINFPENLPCLIFPTPCAILTTSIVCGFKVMAEWCSDFLIGNACWHGRSMFVA